MSERESGRDSRNTRMETFKKRRQPGTMDIPLGITSSGLRDLFECRRNRRVSRDRGFYEEEMRFSKRKVDTNFTLLKNNAF